MFNRFLLPLKEDQRVLYVSKLMAMAQAHSLEPTFKFSGGKEPSKEDLSKVDAAVLRFNFTRASTADASQ